MIPLFSVVAISAEPKQITFDEADIRLKRAYALAQEASDADLSSRMLDLRDRVKAAFDRKDFVAAELIVRDVEEMVHIDAGGKTMFGLPISQVSAEQRKQLDALKEKLAAATAKDDAATLVSTVLEMNRILGDQAGVPDLRRKGDKGKPFPVKPADVADLFIKALEADPRALKALSAGTPTAGTMPRAYASVVQGCLLIRPLVEQHQKAKLEMLDGLIRGSCKAMIALQLDAGFFKFPDVRGKHVRLGEMIERLVAKDPDVIRDGWLIVADEEGGSQVDAGECGIALLRAGRELKNEEWTKAGLKAAQWAGTQNCTPNWNFNAFAVSLLCEASRTTGDKIYLDLAGIRLANGVVVGVAPTGRWLDAFNSRTVNHVILLRAVQDYEETLPIGKQRQGVSNVVSSRVVATLLDEADKLGAPATSHTVQELSRYLRLNPDGDKRARGVLEQAASAVIQKCSAGGRVKAAVPLPELAAAGKVWEK
ncbi:MAG TPA: hypothetical protein VHR66_08840 [Gemmataceae bacterium]|jgi:hypothetical protein|nr:hypothetical protein [Gemmataceae bacterium]